MNSIFDITDLVFLLGKVPGLRKVLDGVDPEILHKFSARAVQERPAYGIRFAPDGHKLLFKQFLDRIVAVDAADMFNFSFGNRLFVGDYRKRFKLCS